MPKVSKRTEAEIAAYFEGALDRVPALDKEQFFMKREAAEKAAQTAAEFLGKPRRQFPHPFTTLPEGDEPPEAA